MTKIAIAEDHTLFRETFASFCIRFGYNLVICATDGIDLINQLQEKTIPDVIFMDIRMPKMNGKQATEIISQRYPSIKVIALSTFEHEKHIVDMFNAGAKGYITKNADQREIVNAVEYVLNEHLYYPEKMLKEWNIPELSGISKKKLKTTLLNEMEYKFLSNCASDDSYQQIADKMGVTYRTVDCFRNTVFKKLCISSRPGLALYVVLNGLSNVIEMFM